MILIPTFLNMLILSVHTTRLGITTNMISTTIFIMVDKDAPDDRDRRQ